MSLPGTTNLLLERAKARTGQGATEPTPPEEPLSPPVEAAPAPPASAPAPAPAPAFDPALMQEAQKRAAVRGRMLNEKKRFMDRQISEYAKAWGQERAEAAPQKILEKLSEPSSLKLMQDVDGLGDVVRFQGAINTGVEYKTLEELQANYGSDLKRIEELQSKAKQVTSSADPVGQVVGTYAFSDDVVSRPRLNVSSPATRNELKTVASTAPGSPNTAPMTVAASLDQTGLQSQVDKVAGMDDKKRKALGMEPRHVHAFVPLEGKGKRGDMRVWLHRTPDGRVGFDRDMYYDTFRTAHFDMLLQKAGKNVFNIDRKEYDLYNSEAEKLAEKDILKIVGAGYGTLGVATTSQGVRESIDRLPQKLRPLRAAMAGRGQYLVTGEGGVETLRGRDWMGALDGLIINRLFGAAISSGEIEGLGWRHALPLMQGFGAKKIVDSDYWGSDEHIEAMLQDYRFEEDVMIKGGIKAARDAADLIGVPELGENKLIQRGMGLSIAMPLMVLDPSIFDVGLTGAGAAGKAAKASKVLPTLAKVVDYRIDATKAYLDELARGARTSDVEARLEADAPDAHAMLNIEAEAEDLRAMEDAGISWGRQRQMNTAAIRLMESSQAQTVTRLKEADLKLQEVMDKQADELRILAHERSKIMPAAKKELAEVRERYAGKRDAAAEATIKAAEKKWQQAQGEFLQKEKDIREKYSGAFKEALNESQRARDAAVEAEAAAAPERIEDIVQGALDLVDKERRTAEAKQKTNESLNAREKRLVRMLADTWEAKLVKGDQYMEEIGKILARLEVDTPISSVDDLRAALKKAKAKLKGELRKQKKKTTKEASKADWRATPPTRKATTQEVEAFALEQIKRLSGGKPPLSDKVSLEFVTNNTRAVGEALERLSGPKKTASTKPPTLPEIAKSIDVKNLELYVARVEKFEEAVSGAALLRKAEDTVLQGKRAEAAESIVRNKETAILNKAVAEEAELLKARGAAQAASKSADKAKSSIWKRWRRDSNKVQDAKEKALIKARRQQAWARSRAQKRYEAGERQAVKGVVKRTKKQMYETSDLGPKASRIKSQGKRKAEKVQEEQETLKAKIEYVEEFPARRAAAAERLLKAYELVARGLRGEDLTGEDADLLTLASNLKLNVTDSRYKHPTTYRGWVAWTHQQLAAVKERMNPKVSHLGREVAAAEVQDIGRQAVMLQDEGMANVGELRRMHQDDDVYISELIKLLTGEEVQLGRQKSIFSLEPNSPWVEWLNWVRGNPESVIDGTNKAFEIVFRAWLPSKEVGLTWMTRRKQYREALEIRDAKGVKRKRAEKAALDEEGRALRKEFLDQLNTRDGLINLVEDLRVGVQSIYTSTERRARAWSFIADGIFLGNSMMHVARELGKSQRFIDFTSEQANAMNAVMVGEAGMRAGKQIPDIKDIDVRKAWRGFEAWGIRPLTERSPALDTALAKDEELTRMMVKVFDDDQAKELGTIPYIPQHYLSALQENTGRLVKELYSVPLKPGPGEQARSLVSSLISLQRRSMVAGVAIPKPGRYFMTGVGEGGQLWNMQNMFTSTRIMLGSTLDYIPFIGHARRNYLAKLRAQVGDRPIVGPVLDAIRDPVVHEVFSQSRNPVVTVNGTQYTGAELFSRLIKDGVKDSIIRQDVTESLRKSPSSGFSRFADKIINNKLGRENEAFYNHTQFLQRSKIYLDILERGGSFADARKAMFEAHFDWKWAANRFEMKWLNATIPFYSFWRNAARQQVQAALEPFTLSNSETLAKAFTGRLKFSQGVQQVRAIKALPDWVMWKDPDETIDDEEQHQWAMQNYFPYWAANNTLLGQFPLGTAEQRVWGERKGTERTHEIVTIPNFAAVDMIMLAGLHVQFATAMAAELMGADFGATGDAPNQLLDQYVDKSGPLLGDFLASGLKTATSDRPVYVSDEEYALIKAVSPGSARREYGAPKVDWFNRFVVKLLPLLSTEILPTVGSVMNPEWEVGVKEGAGHMTRRLLRIGSPIPTAPAKARTRQVLYTAHKLEEEKRRKKAQLSPER